MLLFFSDEKKQKSCPVILANHFLTAERLTFANSPECLKFKFRFSDYLNFVIQIALCTGLNSANFLTPFRRQKMAKIKGRKYPDHVIRNDE